MQVRISLSIEEVRNNPYRLSWLIGVMSNEAWRAVYGHSLDKRLITRQSPALRVLAKNTQNFVAE